MQLALRCAEWLMEATELGLDPRPSVSRAGIFLLSISVYINPAFLVHFAVRNKLPGKGFYVRT